MTIPARLYTLAGRGIRAGWLQPATTPTETQLAQWRSTAAATRPTVPDPAASPTCSDGEHRISHVAGAPAGRVAGTVGPHGEGGTAVPS